MADFPTPAQSLGEPLVTVRGQIEESAASTLTEGNIVLPTNPANNIGFLIRRVHFFLETPVFALPAADAQGIVTTQLGLSTRQGLAAVPTLFADGMIAALERNWVLFSAPADAGLAMSQHDSLPAEWDFSVGGVLTATRVVSLYINSNALATSQLSGIVAMYGHIVRIEAAELIAAISQEAGV